MRVEDRSTQQHMIKSGHNRPPIHLLIGGQPWPEDAQAVIRRRTQPATTSGKARTWQWVLRFERRTPPEIEPLMGWTAGDDTLTQIELTFDTCEQAIAYAERQGFTYRVEQEELSVARARVAALAHERKEHPTAEETMGTVVWLSWIQDRYGRCDAPYLPELDRAFVNPAAVFSSPDDVVRHPLLTLDCKREILWRWAWDEYLLDLANSDGMPEGEPSRLPEVKAALRLVKQEWSPDPAAPAAFIIRYHHDQETMAA
jgi:hypothetical protein